MKILVTGGTGFIGQHLTEILKKKHEVKALSRIEFQKSIDCSGYDIVYHIAGMLGKWGVQREGYFKLHVEATRKLLKTCKGKFIYVSSAGVLGPVENANESFPLNPTNDYEESKAEAEKLVMRYNDYVIVRPEFAYGPGDKHVLPLFKAIRDRRFLIIGKGDSLLHPTYIDDVAYCLQECMNLTNETLLVAGERPVAVKEFAEIVAEELGVRISTLKVPLSIAKAYVWATEKQRLIDPILTRSRMDFFTKTRSFNTDKAKRLLRYRPTPLRKGISKTISWYKEKGYL
jgi:nucleoside-diphosphate-sugar epimerase